MRTLFLAIVILTLGTSLRAQHSDTVPPHFIDVEKEPEAQIPIERLINYTLSARQNLLQGKVTLEFIVDTNGRADSIRVLRSDHDIFNQAAIDAMKREKFSPGISHGKPIKLWQTRVVNFKLY